jgi:hypothetical protein
MRSTACFALTPEETLDRQIYELGNQQWNIPDLRRLLEEILTRDSHFDGYAVTHEFEHIGQRTMLLNARRIRRSSELILHGNRRYYRTPPGGAGRCSLTCDGCARCARSIIGDYLRLRYARDARHTA